MRLALALLAALAVSCAAAGSPTLYTYTITAPSATLSRVNNSTTKGTLALHNVQSHAIWVGTDGGAGVIAIGGLLSSAFRSGVEWLSSPAAVLINEGPADAALAPPPASAAGNTTALREAYDDEDAIVLRLRNGRVEKRDLLFDVEVLNKPDAAPGSKVATTYLNAIDKTAAILSELPRGSVKLNETVLLVDDYAKVSPGSGGAAVAPAPAAQPARKLQGFLGGLATGVGFGVGIGVVNTISNAISTPWGGNVYCSNGCWQCNGNQCCCNGK